MTKNLKNLKIFLKKKKANVRKAASVYGNTLVKCFSSTTKYKLLARFVVTFMIISLNINQFNIKKKILVQILAYSYRIFKI